MAKIVKGKEIRKKAGARAAPVRKHIDVLPESGGVLDHRVISASEKAKKIIANAEAEADRIKEEAEAIKADIIKAREDGRKEGFAKGETQGKAAVTEKVAQLQKLREDFYTQAEPDIIKLVLAVAEKVIGQIADERPDIIRDVVRQALERSLGDRVVVRLNPDDYKTVMDKGYEFRDVLDRTKRIVFKEDDAISKGGCIVETEVGTIDAQLETQLDAIRKALEV